MNNNGDKKISVGLFISEEEIDSWISKAITEISKLELFRISLIIIIKRKQTLRSKLYKSLLMENVLLILFRFLDKMFFRISNYALKKAKLQSCFKDIPLLNTRNSNDDTELHRLLNCAIKRYSIDLMIAFDYGLIPKCLIGMEFKYGLWYFVLGKYIFEGMNELGISELVNKEGEISSQLHILIRTETRVLFSTHSMTDVFSQRVTLDNHLWKLSYLIPEMLMKIESAKRPEDILIQYSKDLKRNVNSNQIRKRRPLTLKLVKHIIAKIISSISKRFNFEQWILLYHPGDWLEAITTPGLAKPIIPPSDRFWADPFIYKKDEMNYIFFEEYENGIGKGYISVLMVDNNFEILNREQVLVRPYHLSYPCIFEFDNQLYMMPESSENRTIELYRCTVFPHKWQFIKYIMQDVTANDATIFFYKGKFWLFVCLASKEVRWNYDDLYIFYNTDLFSDKWIPHPENPVVSDVKSARSAGNMFIHEGKIYRPSQNSSGRYGKGLNINCIELLSESTYREKIAYMVDSSVKRELSAIHTLNSGPEFTIMDGIIKRKRNIIRNFLDNLINYKR